MKRLWARKDGWWLMGWLAVVAVLPACSRARGGEVVDELSPEEKAAGWILLFDGKSMEGWEDPREKTPPGDGWTVEGGCLKAVAKPRIREDLLSKRAFGDFELEFEWKISPRGNSGVKYLLQDEVVLEEGKLKPGARWFEELVEYELRERKSGRGRIEAGHRAEVYTIGFEYQLIDDEGHPDARRGPDRRTGALYGLLAPQQVVPHQVGEFHRSRIVLRGDHVEHWLNGVKVLDASLDSEQVKKRLADRWGEESEVYRLLTQRARRRAPICLQHHNDEVWFRNIKIRPL